MQGRYSLTHLTLVGMVILGLTLLMVVVDAKAQIVFASDRVWADWEWEIYVMDTDGGNQRNLSNAPGDDQYPSWSPDGMQIVFTADRSGKDWNRQIYVMNADGGNPQNLTNNPDDDGWPDDRYPSWSPDGAHIVFTARREEHVENKLAVTYEIYVMDVDGGNLQNLTNNPHSDASPAWLNSPFSVAPAGKQFIVWGSLKQADQ